MRSLSYGFKFKGTAKIPPGNYVMPSKDLISSSTGLKKFGLWFLVYRSVSDKRPENENEMAIITH